MRVSKTPHQRNPERSSFKEKPVTDFFSAVSLASEKIALNSDAQTIASALCSIYLKCLERILVRTRKLDQARDLDERGTAASREAIRFARFALKDESDLLASVDRVVRGLCECLGTRTRVSFEARMRINGAPEQPSDELSRLRVHCMMIELIVEKCRLYGLPLPRLKQLRELMEKQRREEVHTEQEQDQRDVLAMGELLKRLNEDADVKRKK